VKIC
jgi:GTPase SAR1 family protein